MVNMLQLSERARFKSGDFGLEDEERPGQPKKFEDEDLEALLDEDSCQTHKAAGYIQKQVNWVPRVLKPRDVKRRFRMSEILCQRNNNRLFNVPISILFYNNQSVTESRKFCQDEGKTRYQLASQYGRRCSTERSTRVGEELAETRIANHRSLQ